MSQRPTYRVTVEREEQLWTAVVDGLPTGVFGATDTDHFGDLDDMVRDLVVTITDAPPDAFDLTWRYAQGASDYTAELEQAQYWTEQFRVAEAGRDACRSAAAEAMARAGLSQRAIGDALGLSHQRIGQILGALGSPTASSPTAPTVRRAG